MRLKIFQNHPHLAELAYRAMQRWFLRLDPVIRRVGYRRVDRLLTPLEKITKGPLFDCQMCGQCILRLTGMTCPMTCPKSIRNGPCGGVRPGGYCEVKPEMRCVWVEAYERSRRMPIYGERMLDLQPAVDWRLQDTSAWVNMLTGADRPSDEGAL